MAVGYLNYLSVLSVLSVVKKNCAAERKGVNPHNETLSWTRNLDISPAV